MTGFVRIVLWAFLASICSLAMAKDTAGMNQRFGGAMELIETDRETGLAMLQDLADEGHARALDRFGYFYFTGKGVPQDLDASVELYGKAIASGHRRSLLSLGKVHLKRGDYAAAERVFLQAVSEGIPKADITHAWAHATGRFGAISRADAGLEVLRRAATAGSEDAQRLLLAALIAQPGAAPMPGEDFARLQARAAQGSAKDAEALLRYYRLRGHPSGTVEARQRLLHTPGLRAKIATEEALHLAVRTDAPRFWPVSEAIVARAPNDVFARALVVTARLSRNAYLRILQRELEALGYETGRRTAFLHGDLIAAINRFCRDSGVAARCAAGPLKSSTIKVIAPELAKSRIPDRSFDG